MLYIFLVRNGRFCLVVLCRERSLCLLAVWTWVGSSGALIRLLFISAICFRYLPVVFWVVEFQSVCFAFKSPAITVAVWSGNSSWIPLVLSVAFGEQYVAQMLSAVFVVRT